MKISLKFIFLILLPIALISSCSDEQEQPPQGTYYASLPCADCEAIEYEITFNEDSTYTSKSVYKGKSTSPYRQKGRFEFNDDLITLKGASGKAGMNKLSYDDGELEMLNKDGEEIEGEMEDLYLFSKEKPEGFMTGNEATTNRNNSRENITFRAASSKNDAWDLKILGNKWLVFESDAFTIKNALTKMERPVDTDGISYRTSSDKGDIHLTIYKEACEDSGLEFTKARKILVRVSEAGSEEMTSYYGCGTFSGEYDINGLWILQSINGEQIPGDRKAPNLEFMLYEGKLSGFGGCNRISGDVNIQEGLLTFSNLAVTEMACPGVDFEDDFIKALREGRFEYLIRDNRLLLESDEKILRFELSEG